MKLISYVFGHSAGTQVFLNFLCKIQQYYAVMLVSYNLKMLSPTSTMRSSSPPSPTQAFLTRQIFTESSKDKTVHWLKKESKKKMI